MDCGSVPHSSFLSEHELVALSRTKNDHPSCPLGDGNSTCGCGYPTGVGAGDIFRPRVRPAPAPRIGGCGAGFIFHPRVTHGYPTFEFCFTHLHVLVHPVHLNPPLPTPTPAPHSPAASNPDTSTATARHRHRPATVPDTDQHHKSSCSQLPQASTTDRPILFYECTDDLFGG
jgi:hypothetical protein